MGLHLLGLLQHLQRNGIHVGCRSRPPLRVHQRHVHQGRLRPRRYRRRQQQRRPLPEHVAPVRRLEVPIAPHTWGRSPALYCHVNESKLSKTGNNLACHIASHGLTLGAIMHGVDAPWFSTGPDHEFNGKVVITYTNSSILSYLKNLAITRRSWSLAALVARNGCVSKSMK